MEKSGIAQFIDKLVDGMGKMKSESSDVVNVLPKPESQEIGDGVIVWRWTLCNGHVVIESVLATREPNQSKTLKKDEYNVSMKLPESENFTYVLEGDIAKQIGQAILSAYNWKEIWKLHAGDFLLAELSQEDYPVRAPEVFQEEITRTVPSFDNG